MATEWYYKAIGETFGPISASALAATAHAGTISADSPIRCGRSGAWISASTLEGLFDVRSGPSPHMSNSADGNSSQALLIFVGIVLVFIGGIGGVIAWTMKTTVTTEYGQVRPRPGSEGLSF